MESFTHILSHLDLPTSSYKALIQLYQHCIDTNTELCTSVCLNNDIEPVLIENLVQKSYETSSIIREIQIKYNKKHSQPFGDIFSTAIVNHLELFSQDNPNITAATIYCLLSFIKYCDKTIVFDCMFSKIYELIENAKLNKELVYLTLLPQQNLEILRMLLKYEKLHFDKCDLNDSATLFRYCLYKNRHWLFHILENDIDHRLPIAITDKLWLLKMIYYSNCSNNNKQIAIAISKLTKHTIKDTFLQFYYTEIKWNLEFYDDLLRLNPATQIKYNLANIDSCLVEISKIIDLKEISKYADICDVLIRYEKYVIEIQQIKNLDLKTTISELDIYNGYCLILAIIHLINDTLNLMQDDLYSLVKRTKAHILTSANLNFQLEIFENIFALIFLQGVERSTFLCTRLKIQFITMFLKTGLREIKLKHFAAVFDKSSRNYARFCALTNYLNDALWRLELLRSQNISDIDRENIVSVMLSSPNTFIYMCLENDDFVKAHEVVQIFNMENTEIAQEIEFMEKMQYLKSSKDKNVMDIITFCNENHIVHDKEFLETFESFKDIKIVEHCIEDNEVFINLMDTALTSNDNYDTNKQLFDAALAHKTLQENTDCDFIQFCYNIIEIFNHIGPKANISTSAILNCTKYPLNINKLKQQQLHFDVLNETFLIFKSQLPDGLPGDFNAEHICSKTFDILADIFVLFNVDNNYLSRLFKYLTSTLNIFYVRNNNSDLLAQGKETCIFDLLSINLPEIIAILIAKREVKPKDLEPIFCRSTLDLVYHIAWSCFPDVQLQIKNANHVKNIECNETSFYIFLQKLKEAYNFNFEAVSIWGSPDIFLLSYIRKRNWLLAYLINKIHVIEEAKPDTNSDRTKYFNHLLNLKSVNHLKILFNYNAASTVLHHDIQLPTLLLYLEKTEQISEDNVDWKSLLDIIDSFPERQLHNDFNLIHMRDIVLFNLVSGNKTSEYYKTVEYIFDVDLRIKCILDNLTNWSGEHCVDILNSQLTNSKLATYKEELAEWFYKIELYEHIKSTFESESWIEIYNLSNTDPKNIFLLLLTSKQIMYLLKWIEIHKPVSLDLLCLININYFILILEDGVDLNQVKILLNLLQFDQRIQICKDILRHIKKLEYLQFIIDYLITLLPELESEYINITISLQMFSCFNSSEHEFMLCLINKPLLIIEQLIMNTRLEKLDDVLEKIKPILQKSKEKNFIIDISIESIDLLLRTYAKKSLDFHGIQPSVRMHNIDMKLMQSLDTLSEDSERKMFVIPEDVPDKANWTLNEEAAECMCCREVTFSMFNRRHHCRRCGRVVCGNCSHKRMEIPEYGSIPVRICSDCYKQSQPEDQSTSMKSEQCSSKSGSLDCWLLSEDDKHNDIAREEFSYEYAPSVSLCLSILKLHSNTVEYPQFLIELSKILLPYLEDSVSEIDFSFVIKMIKSLVTAAKINSLNQSYKAETAKCNEMFSHIELFSLLIEKDCFELFRATTKSSSNEIYVDSGVLRRLRDTLLEQEQWLLALDVSTKAGLDKTGVFAAWGKNCLKAGCLQLARKKFQYCLERKAITTNEMSTSLDLSVSSDLDEARTKSRSMNLSIVSESKTLKTDFDDVRSRPYLRSTNLSVVSESRTFKTPPLVNEIISVLESNSRIKETSVLMTFDSVSLNSSTLSLNTTPSSVSYDPAVCVLNKLKHLKDIASGSYLNDGQARSRKNSKISIEKVASRHFMDPCFYNECLYYLMRYGSHSSILNFYIRHEEFDETLQYILENRLQTDVFIDIYMKCLEDGKIEILQEHMQKIDCTLNSWEVYLKAICRHFETNRMFNVLYQLQQFMCDYVRAAMTCIRFYQENTKNFQELLEHEEYLQRAQSHLKQELEQEQWVQVTKVRKISTSSISSVQSINQPSLLMKIDPRNIDRYINTIWRQIEVTKFLAKCESENLPTLEVISEIFTFEEEESSSAKLKIPTLFNSQLDKMKLAVLVVVCGKNIEEGFGIAFRIIQDHNLKYLKIYCLAGKYLAQILRETAVIELINCIQSSGLNAETVCATCDEVLMISVCALMKANGTGMQLDKLIKLITDVEVKINAYIEIKQLKRAYLLAVRHNKNNEIRMILREAERQNQPQIKAICMKRLNQTQ